jgi:hypothetical protein
MIARWPLHAQASQADWATAWAAGRALTATQAIVEALEDVDTIPSSNEQLLLIGNGPI